MRLLFFLIALLALPVLVLVHRQYFFMSLQGPLLVKVASALEAPEFAQVDTTVSYADVVLTGRVPELALRAKARELVDGIRGLRCREQDNHLQVPAKLRGALDGKVLTLTGCVHDEGTLAAALEWIESFRPGLTIEAAEVEISPHVTVEELLPQGEEPPRLLRNVWAALRVPASLKVVRDGATLAVTGFLPSRSLASAVSTALAESRPEMHVVADGLTTGGFVTPWKFADESAMPAFLRSFFGSPDPRSVEVDEAAIRVSGKATPQLHKEWMAMLESLAGSSAVEADLQVFPSRWHFPGYTPESQIAPEALRGLQEVLRAAMIQFESGVASLAATELPKLEAAAAAIHAAGPGVRLVIGGHVDATGSPAANETMARRRAESVAADLVGRGVPAHCVEVAVFGAVPGGEDFSRRVELLVK